MNLRDLYVWPMGRSSVTTQAAPQQARAHTPAAIPPPRPSGNSVTVDTALSVSAVYRSVSIIVASVSSMDLGVFRTLNGVTSEIDLPTLIKNPNVNDTASGFIEETTFSLAAHGNAYWRLYRSAPGEPVQSIEVLDPTTVSWTKDDNGKITYHHGQKDFQAWQIKHLKLMRKPGQVAGLGPIQAGAREIQAALDLRAYAENWFSGVPTNGYLSSDQHLGPEETAQYAEAWKRFLEEHLVGVLGQGLEYKNPGVDPEKAQFTDVQRIVVTNIARLFGIPATYLLAAVEGNSMTYTNLEQVNIIFLQTCLSRFMGEIENALSDLLPRGQKVQFKEEGLLRMDSKTLWEVRKIQTDVGYTSGSELRAIEGKDPLPSAS